MILKGDTVRFECQFKWFDGEDIPYEAQNVTFKIFDVERKEIETRKLSLSHTLNPNHYYYDYTVPDTFEGLSYIEFKGYFRENPFVVREDFTVQFDN